MKVANIGKLHRWVGGIWMYMGYLDIGRVQYSVARWAQNGSTDSTSTVFWAN